MPHTSPQVDSEAVKLSITIVVQQNPCCGQHFNKTPSRRDTERPSRASTRKPSRQSRPTKPSQASTRKPSQRTTDKPLRRTTKRTVRLPILPAKISEQHSLPAQIFLSIPISGTPKIPDDKSLTRDNSRSHLQPGFLERLGVGAVAHWLGTLLHDFSKQPAVVTWLHQQTDRLVDYLGNILGQVHYLL